jgi:hypothetical protein
VLVGEGYLATRAGCCVILCNKYCIWWALHQNARSSFPRAVHEGYGLCVSVRSVVTPPFEKRCHEKLPLPHSRYQSAAFHKIAFQCGYVYFRSTDWQRALFCEG